MSATLWFMLAFLSGAVPYSPILTRLFTRQNIRAVGDGNPGATNVIKAGGQGLGLAAILLDGFKGAIPVALAYWGAGWRGWALTLIALAPVFGHAYSPFLKLRGGKALATTFGIWAGLTGPEVPITLGILMAVWFNVLTTSGWGVLAAMLCLGAHILNYHPEFALIWLVNCLLLAWKYRADLGAWPHLRPTVLQWAQTRLTPHPPLGGHRESK